MVINLGEWPTYYLAVKHGSCFIDEPFAAWRQLEDSYSPTVARNVQKSQENIDQASHLLRGIFSDLFSLDFVDQWEKRERLNCYLSRYLEEQNSVLRNINSVVPWFNALDKALLSTIRWSTKIHYVIMKSYFYRRIGLSSNRLYMHRINSVLKSIVKQRVRCKRNYLES